MEVLQTVTGIQIKTMDLPLNNQVQYPINQKDDEFITNEIATLLNKDVIVQCKHEPREVISQIFVRDKPDGGSRLILNLKKLN